MLAAKTILMRWLPFAFLMYPKKGKIAATALSVSQGMKHKKRREALGRPEEILVKALLLG